MTSNDEDSELDVSSCTETMKRLRKTLGNVMATGQPESSPVVTEAKQLLDTLDVLHTPNPVPNIIHIFIRKICYVFIFIFFNYRILFYTSVGYVQHAYIRTSFVVA